MIEFRPINDVDPALAHSPLVRATEKTFAYIAEHDSIGLTPSMAFKRNFVHWAAAEFEWPQHTADDLFKLNKVLNEADFLPLLVLHDLLIHLRIGRHYRGAFRLTRAGEELVGKPGKIFGILTPFFLFEVNHSSYARFNDEPLGNWDIFLNVLNVEAEDGLSAEEFAQLLYGKESGDAMRIMTVRSILYSHVLRPLCWAGLLSEHRSGRGFLATRTFIKTPLWKTALRLTTDSTVTRAVRH
ncbi:hypothetical protein [Oricola indica]|uniref:hypothetical protein n=1 Tax=Oricola indica TaxID=2872591 RepID=UPI003CCC09EE